MPLHPQARSYLDLVTPAGTPELQDFAAPVAELRKIVDAMFVARASSGAIEIARVENRTIPGPAGEIGVRVYTPHSLMKVPFRCWFISTAADG